MSNNRIPLLAVVAVAAAALLAGCASTPVQAPLADSFDPVAAVAAIRTAGHDGNAQELVVTPLGANQVADLRAQASRQLETGEVGAAAATLDQALELTPRDPSLLQQRAELALLLRDLEGARGLARAAIEAGTGVGPHCRRHWETLHQVALVYAARDPQWEPVAARARDSRDACTVGPVPRY